MIKGWLNPNGKSQPENLLCQYRETGEQRYLTLLVNEYNPALFHYLLTLSDKALAEDMAQITWMKVMKSAQKYQKNTNVKNWLFSIARNSLIDELRRQNRWQWQELEEGSIEHRSHSPEQVLQLKEQQDFFNHALEALPFYQREAFIFQQEGFSLTEICQLTNENFETVKTRLRYAKQKIKQTLERTDAR